MTEKRFLAFDLGAESGRAVVGTLAGQQLTLEEIHRFANEPVEVAGTLFWDVLALYNNILKGMRAYVQRWGDAVDGIGIDTWAIDFGFLARDGSLLQNPVCYRDKRTAGIVAVIEETVARDALYQTTGLNLLGIETLCQMVALRKQDSPILAAAETFLMMPDLLAYFLSGEQCCERSNAASSQLYDIRNGAWSDETLDLFGLPKQIMPRLVDPGTILGELTDAAKAQTGLKSAPVIAPCTHDTTSAVAAVPGQGRDWAFISSGTWSVVGAVTEDVFTSTEAQDAGLCNELTLGGPFLCRNIMGLWLLQQARAVWQRQGNTYSYAELVELAQEAPVNGPLVDPNDARFLGPEDMTAAVRDYCEATAQTVPDDTAKMARCIMESLALSYRQALDDISRVTSRQFATLHIVGGGSQNQLLSQLTADATGRRVIAGPVEATAAGNVLAQALACGCVSSPQEIRNVVRQSSGLVEYEPKQNSGWERRNADFQAICERAGA